MSFCIECNKESEFLRRHIVYDPYFGVDIYNYYCEKCHPEAGSVFPIGTKVKLVGSGLDVDSDLQPYIEKETSTIREVLWSSHESQYLGQTGFIVSPLFSVLLKYEVLVKFDSGDYVQFHPDWLEKVEENCICPINTLMEKGCICGQMEREREQLDNSNLMDWR